MTSEKLQQCARILQFEAQREPQQNVQRGLDSELAGSRFLFSTTVSRKRGRRIETGYAHSSGPQLIESSVGSPASVSVSVSAVVFVFVGLFVSVYVYVYLCVSVCACVFVYVCVCVCLGVCM